VLKVLCSVFSNSRLRKNFNKQVSRRCAEPLACGVAVLSSRRCGAVWPSTCGVAVLSAAIPC
jgi:hypothetical protein